MGLAVLVGLLLAVVAAAAAATAASSSSTATPLRLFVAPGGSDANSGRSATAPLATCAGAVARLAALPAVPVGGAEVQFAAGTYVLNATTACGEVALRGSEGSPVVFRGDPAAPPGAVVFDAARRIDTSRLGPVTDRTALSLLHPAARGRVVAVPAPPDVDWRTVAAQQLEWGGVPMHASAWPNTGLAYVYRVFDQGAVYDPGRTKGPPPVMHTCTGDERSTPARPCGANISLAEQPGGAWAAEMAAGPGYGRNVTVRGYLDNDWYRMVHTVVRVEQNATNTSLQFGESDHYGVCEAMVRSPLRPDCGAAPGRFVLRGLLSEVDTSGEYFYHLPTRTLYLIPASNSDPAPGGGSPLGYWAGPGLMTLANASWVTVRDVTVTGSAGTVFTIEGGANNTIGGCTVRSSVAGVAVVGGHQHRVIGNDIYDMAASHVTTAGDPAEGLDRSSALGRLVPTNNLVANNHLTQLHLGPRLAWGVGSSGMGDRYRQNLLHDSPQQLIHPGGPLVLWDHNEVFNTGYAEGDGGVMYDGASLVQGYGTHVRNNFLHHSLDVPGLTERAGIYWDDFFAAVSNTSGNVLFKAAGFSVLVNGGAGCNVTRNLIAEGGQGISQRATGDVVTPLPAYDNGTLHRGDKGDYIWRTERDLGVASFAALFATPLAARFPTFASLLSLNSTTAGWASPAASDFSGNLFLNNSAGNLCFEVAAPGTGAHSWHCSNATSDAALAAARARGLPAAHYLRWDGSREADWAWFPGAARLEFVNRSLGLDTGRSGLECDDFRRTLPDPALYRPWVKRAFAAIPASAAGPYTPAAAAAVAGLRSGAALLLNFSRPCPPSPPPRDCDAVWLDWGECQADGHKVRRYTIERDSIAGGRPCPHLDGHTELWPCPRRRACAGGR